ncbi:glycoside hydrolase family 88 protein [Galbibacter mesophilus]|uniref:glycoside hydrolase family 88 protein n=1 Tax=Galbibacter mesophilus TaxID=379069 RepID=UPI00191FC597|nr:glycoside hydrolase family 88 protein [Galbibacter mesophilus]MCM5664345.1 glycoside hydrolase family 88 protein [Galbibacter mesophilus]
MKINTTIKFTDFSNDLNDFWKLVTKKVWALHKNYDESQGSPVFTVEGKYTTRGWTEWTQGFQFGIPLLAFDATGDKELLALGKQGTMNKMTHHLSHFGVHDHGFNNVSTYGNLLRLANEERYKGSDFEKDYYKLALKMSGSVQAKRWTEIPDGGYLYSFNGPHSLFIDTVRTCRILLAAHKLEHRMLEEHDEEIDLLQRAITHGLTTAKYAVFYGEGRDSYDEWGRVAHESIFNLNDGAYRCPNSQQGFSGFTTWTRGLAWAMVGFPEFIEYLDFVGGYEKEREIFLKAARASCDFFIDNTSSDGIPYWDAGAPNLHKLGNYQEKEADPYNDYEPVDSSAAAIGAQGLLRLGQILKEEDPSAAKKYQQAGLTTLQTLLKDVYLAKNEGHQGILKHSVYHHPNGWDHIPEGRKVPADESSMWGDYHMVELCLYAQRLSEGKNYRFFDGIV